MLNFLIVLLVIIAGLIIVPQICEILIALIFFAFRTFFTLLKNLIIFAIIVVVCFVIALIVRGFWVAVGVLMFLGIMKLLQMLLIK